MNAQSRQPCEGTVLQGVRVEFSILSGYLF